MKPKLVSEVGNSRSEFEHPAFGNVTVSRVSSNSDIDCFGSSVKTHNCIEIEVNHAKLTRDLNNDWIHDTGSIVRFRMSLTQWSEFVSSIGQGGGTPITLVRHEGKSVEELEWENETIKIENEFKNHMDDITSEMQKISKDVDDILAKPAINKGDRKAIHDNINMLLQEIRSNIPFIKKQFSESMDKTISEGKAQIEAFIAEKIRSNGMQAMSSEIKNNLLTEK